ncbi:16S rRNA (guanine(527)-N(7))-methyltransferase RsmG [Solwaraspora sp. WMMD791]|uniref:16S rRNA (guanine(527)-N(7))-methyltransferase RsmG n=1 Tax=Solwaraspora sp. WMMD791 TaxID=3016086 RepID=UPI00249C4D2B|nr:16S rRNA (guanine(527)-N(7))-methyltransferase RsmG [Solwaraspora sp. WMMD791]WFE30658.1 16S rRNA (guanine(527)-N(7))-methyltransferase RsmG [Solwaraspora sp. WMMD791]
MSGPVPSTAVPTAAAEIFGPQRLPLAVRYADLLATEGTLRGLIGPREVPRLWDRHLLNCAVLGELVPTGSTVVDVGSGAGLPGLALAIARPDLSVVLVEPLARRTAFLAEAVDLLGLTGAVEVVRGRAEELVRSRPDCAAPIVTARAVAPLDRLVGWCLPLVEPGGRLLAMKGGSAAAEVAEHRGAVVRAGGAEPVLRTCGERWLDPPTTVVEIGRVGGTAGTASARSRAATGRGRSARSGRAESHGRSQSQGRSGGQGHPAGGPGRGGGPRRGGS